MSKISPFLWFDTQAEEAAKLYTSVFPNSKVLDVQRQGPEAPVFLVTFELDGTFITALNGGPVHANFTEAFSFQVDCADQAEVDHYWSSLTADGGEPGPCGWLKDKYGLSWQIVPRALPELLGDPDREAADRVLKAMLSMQKIDIEALRAAYAG